MSNCQVHGYDILLMHLQKSAHKRQQVVSFEARGRVCGAGAGVNASAGAGAADCGVVFMGEDVRCHAAPEHLQLGGGGRSGRGRRAWRRGGRRGGRRGAVARGHRR